MILSSLSLIIVEMGNTSKQEAFCSKNNVTIVYASGIDGLAKHGFACGGHKDASSFKESILEFSTCLMRTIKCAETEVAKQV